jgi:hypothetical protein
MKKTKILAEILRSIYLFLDRSYSFCRIIEAAPSQKTVTPLPLKPVATIESQLSSKTAVASRRVILPRRSGQRFSHSRTGAGSPISPNTNNDQK